MDKDDTIVFIFFIIYTIIGWCACTCYHKNDKQNAAMEVYRGNTKLEYTVVDSMVVDSCVIFIDK